MEILSPRWYGRLQGLLLIVARRKGVTFEDQQSVTMVALLSKVLALVDDDLRSVINELMRKWNDAVKVENDSGIAISEDEGARLVEVGRREAAFVMQSWLYRRLLENVDLDAEREAAQAAEERKKRRNRVITLSVLGALVLFIVIYNLPYFKELRFYNEVRKTQTVEQCNKYYSEYPEGRHYEDVMGIESQISPSPVKVLARYLNRFPDGKYADEMSREYETLWNEEIAIYEHRDKTGEDPEAVRYMDAMLHYMKDNRLGTVCLRMNPHIDLKDISEYDETALDLLGMFMDSSLPLTADNILSLKDNFTSSDKGVLMQILSEGIEESFGRMFSPDFVSVVPESSAEEKSPVLTIDYEIKNELFYEGEEGYDLPSIWVYSVDGVPKAYVLAIKVEFDARFSLPGSDMTYAYSEVGDPGEEIAGILSIKDGYRRMTQRCFAKFSDMMSKNLGLDPVYFEE